MTPITLLILLRASKFVDSHLKPYRCKVRTCENSRFSSTACLLRHEREAHAMHGHGDKPYLCPYEGCERSAPGNGFPRAWNLGDHKRRVHSDPGQPKSNASSSPPPTYRGRNKRKAGVEIINDKALKRIATPPVPTEPSLVDHYRQNEQKLHNLVSQLQEQGPKNGGNMELLRNVSDCVRVMAQTTQRINSAPRRVQDPNQQSG